VTGSCAAAAFPVAAPRAAAALILTLAAAGCGESRPAKVESEMLERDMIARFTAATGTLVTGVECPDDVEVREGRVIECRASFGGEPNRLVVTLRGAPGRPSRYTATLKYALLGRMKEEMRRRYGGSAGVRAVQCPEPQPQRPENFFFCTVVRADGRRIQLRVVQIDDRGTLRFGPAPAPPRR